MIDKKNYSILAHNTFGVEASCNRFVQVENIAEAQAILPSLSYEDILIIGKGSNILFTKDFNGVIVRSAIRGIEKISEGNDVLLRCGSGEVWDDIVAYSVAQNLHGAENLSYIPGDVGASAVQNIGAYGAEIQDIIHDIEAIEIASGNIFHFSKNDCQYSYRQSIFKREWNNRFFITHVTYRLSRQFHPKLTYKDIANTLETHHISHPTAQQLRDIVIAIRKEKLPDPTLLGNAGSFFTNPIVVRSVADELLLAYPQMPVYDVDADMVKLSSGWLIEQCGWKGRTEGKVGVYEKQALVLVNFGGATGKDILQLCQKVQADVHQRFNIEIIPEVKIV